MRWRANRGRTELVARRTPCHSTQPKAGAIVHRIRSRLSLREPVLESCAINDIVAEAVRLLQRDTTRLGLTVEQELGAELPGRWPIASASRRWCQPDPQCLRCHGKPGTCGSIRVRTTAQQAIAGLGGGPWVVVGSLTKGPGCRGGISDPDRTLFHHKAKRHRAGAGHLPIHPGGPWRPALCPRHERGACVGFACAPPQSAGECAAWLGQPFFCVMMTRACASIAFLLRQHDVPVASFASGAQLLDMLHHARCPRASAYSTCAWTPCRACRCMTR